MKNILIFFVLFLYTRVYAMENQNKPITIIDQNKPLRYTINSPLANSLPIKRLFLDLPKTKSMFKTTLVNSKKELFLCQICESIFYEKQLADEHDSECQYCKSSIPKCALKAHEDECKYHTIQQ